MVHVRQKPRENAAVLATVDENSYKPQTDIKMGDHPVIWYNPKKKAKEYLFPLRSSRRTIRCKGIQAVAHQHNEVGGEKRIRNEKILNSSTRSLCLRDQVIA